MTGIVITDSIVLKETVVTESDVSPPYLEANIVVIAAVGAQAHIVQATSTSPLIPQRYIPNKTKAGNRSNLIKIVYSVLRFLSPSKTLLFARW